MKYIYHIHDQCCHHASNTLETIVKTAIKEKYRELFFTEHCPLDNNSYLVRPTRAEINDLRKRIDEVNRQYKGKLFIHFGFEAEYSKGNKTYFDKFANDPQCDYLIFGNHYLGDLGKPNPRLVMDELHTKADLDEYYENTVLAMKSKLFSGYAHPDIWLQGYRKGDTKAKRLTKEIINLSIKYKLPLGFNANGIHQVRDQYHYPSKLFGSEVAKSKAQVLIEADAHDISTLQLSGLQRAKVEANKCGLEKNLITKPRIHYFHKTAP